MKHLTTSLFSCLLFSVSSFAAIPGVPTSCHVIDSATKKGSTLTLPAGEILYKEATSTTEASGFTASSVVTAIGKVQHHVLDCPSTLSSKAISEQLLSAMQLGGFDIAYTCQQTSCGKKDGFRLYLSPRLNDPTGTQHYVLAKRGEHYRAFYVAEIDHQPRLYTAEVIPASGASLGNMVSFSVNSAEIDRSEMKKIDSWVTLNITDNAVISVTGYADASGTFARNQDLSKQRANNVKQYLMERHRISEDRISTIATANVSRTQNGLQGRLVELIAHTAEKSEAHLNH